MIPALDDIQGADDVITADELEAAVREAKLPPCPWCGKSALILEQHCPCEMAVICCNCGASGPPHHRVAHQSVIASARIALELWTHRVGRPVIRGAQEIQNMTPKKLRKKPGPKPKPKNEPAPTPPKETGIQRVILTAVKNWLVTENLTDKHEAAAAALGIKVIDLVLLLGGRPCTPEMFAEIASEIPSLKPNSRQLLRDLKAEFAK